MQINNSPHLDKKIIFTTVLALVVVVVAGLWYFDILKKKTPEIDDKIVIPVDETEKIDEFSEFPEDVRPLLKNSLDEALEDIKALEL